MLLLPGDPMGNIVFERLRLGHCWGERAGIVGESKAAMRPVRAALKPTREGRRQWHHISRKPLLSSRRQAQDWHEPSAHAHDSAFRSWAVGSGIWGGSFLAWGQEQRGVSDRTLRLPHRHTAIVILG